MNNIKKLEVLDLLDGIEDMLENVSSVPFTGKIMLNRNELIDIISKISAKIPEEYQHVKYLFRNRDEILADAEKEAKIIVENAHKKENQILNGIEVKKKELNIQFTEEHRKLIDNSEVVIIARKKAEEIINDAKLKANGMRNSSFDYSHEMLMKSRNDLEARISVLNRNISELEKMK